MKTDMLSKIGHEIQSAEVIIQNLKLNIQNLVPPSTYTS